jgi:thiosulfate reductase cytochrome b subunit
MGFLIKKASGLIINEIVTTLNNAEIAALNSTYIAIGTIPATAKIINIQLTANAQVVAWSNLNVLNNVNVAVATLNNTVTEINTGYVYHFCIGFDVTTNLMGYELRQATTTLTISAITPPVTLATVMTVKLSYFN